MMRGRSRSATAWSTRANGRRGNCRWLIERHGAELCGDIRADEVCVAQDHAIVGALEQASEQYREKGIARADGVSNLYFVP